MNKQIAFLAKGFMGYLIVVAISILSKTDNYYIAGLIPLFPTFAIIAHVIVYKNNSIESLKETILFGIFSLVTYLVYLLSIYVCIEFMDFYLCVGLSVSLWLLSAVILIKIWPFIYKPRLN